MAKYTRHIHTIAAALLSGLSLAACSDKIADELPGGDDGNASLVQFEVKTSGSDIVVRTTARANADFDPRNYFPLGNDFIENTSRIRVCSVDRNAGSQNRHPNYDAPYESRDTDPTAYHEYICQKRFPYEDYSYFSTYGDAIALKWDDVGSDGKVIENSGNILKNEADGGYYVFAAMYPFTYQRPGSGTELAVKEDQTYHADTVRKYGHFAADLLLNDIRLCQRQFGRDKFRTPIRLDFNHSLCLLVVNVEVPRYLPLDGLGFKDEDLADNPPKMQLEHVTITYSPDYDKSYDRDDHIIVRAGKDATKTIRMFHTPNFANPNSEGFTSEDTYWDQEQDHAGVVTPVKWMQFCAIVPPVRTLDGTRLHFEICGKKYNYAMSSGSAILFEQGCVTTLTLYIPRGESDPVLIGAKLNDWGSKRTPVIPLQ